MILIQALLIISLLFIMIKFLAARNSSRSNAWKKIMLICFTLGAIIAVLFPEVTDQAAHMLGVGRGADLLLYMLVVAFIFTQMNSYVKAKEEKKRIVTLARRIAILDALTHDKQL